MINGGGYFFIWKKLKIRDKFLNDVGGEWNFLTNLLWKKNIFLKIIKISPWCTFIDVNVRGKQNLTYYNVKKMINKEEENPAEEC